MKPMNKAGLKTAAESVEQRAGTEGNADEQWPAHETFAVGGRAGRGPFTKNEPRPTPGLLRSVIWPYRTCALAAAATAGFLAAAATAEGSAKAITASPSS
jgi:hypothetical protein